MTWAAVFGVASAAGLLLLFLRTRLSAARLLAAAPDGFVVVNEKGVVRFLNKAAPLLLRRSRRALMGRFLMDPKACGRRTEIKLKGTEARQHTLEIRGTPIRWNGRPAHLLYVRDITEQKNREHEQTARAQTLTRQLKEASRRKDRDNELEAEREKAALAARDLADWKRSVTESLRYALGIQQRILPDPNTVLSHYRDGFIYLRPRDIISGDFYWFSRRDPVRVLVCADCTGHGVPGALMTLLGNDLLRALENEPVMGQPDAMLEWMDRHFERLAGSGALPLRDGMELAVCALDEQNRLTYAGARIPLFIARENGPVEIIKGTPRTVGLSFGKTKRRPFRSVEISLERGDAFYMISDGFQDQFGGAKGRKFMRKRLANHLNALRDRPMSEQARLINEDFERWKGDHTQIDDVLVIGIRV